MSDYVRFYPRNNIQDFPIRKIKSEFYVQRKTLVIVGAVILVGFAAINLFRVKAGSSSTSKTGNNSVLSAHIDPEVAIKQKYQGTKLTSYDSDASWNPNDLEKYGTDTEPSVQGKSALLVDINSNQILYEKNSTDRMKIASITKIMTAIVALEHAKLTDTFTVSEKAATIGENVAGLSEGEKYTLEELLYGLVLDSGNDAAYTIAEGVAGDESTFVKWMNIKAKELGLNDTYFADPSGLDDSTYSTTDDLVKLTRYALKFPIFKEVVKTVKKDLSSDTHKYISLDNQTNLLTTYPGVAGVKTGYTEEAGLCLVTYAENDGKEVIGVVLDSTDRKGDMILMLDHGYSTIGVKISHPALDY